MAKLLYIEASPRKKRSSSIAIARFFLDAYKKANPHDEVKEVDLWNRELPEFDGEVIDAKYAIMHGQAKSEQQVAAWKAVEKLIEEFKDADKYLFSLPMWNFGIPYKLKHYFDILVQPGYTFTVTPQGYQGLINDKKVLIIYSRGGAYEAGTAAQELDLQKKYMETILNFIGFKSYESIVIEPTLAGEEQKESTLKLAREKAEQLVASFSNSRIGV